MGDSKAKLTDKLVRDAAPPDGAPARIIWDTEVAGFGLRVTRDNSGISGNVRSFILNYRTRGEGRQRRYTIVLRPS
jgi:hypothetical protein